MISVPLFAVAIGPRRAGHPHWLHAQRDTRSILLVGHFARSRPDNPASVKRRSTGQSNSGSRVCKVAARTAWTRSAPLCGVRPLMAEARAALRQLVRAVDSNITSKAGNPLWRQAVFDEFRWADGPCLCLPSRLAEILQRTYYRDPLAWHLPGATDVRKRLAMQAACRRVGCGRSCATSTGSPRCSLLP